MGQLNPKGREDRVRILMTEIHLAYLTTRQPFATEATAVAAGNRLRAAIDRILNEEHTQGAEDGAAIATDYIKKNYELREIWD